jgi:hypothetical protein
MVLCNRQVWQEEVLLTLCGGGCHRRTSVPKWAVG